MNYGSYRSAVEDDVSPLPASDLLLEQFRTFHPIGIDLSLRRIERLLASLDSPERRLAPVIHVAGTNGKGSTIAFLRAIAAKAGLTANIYTSPHLVRFHERIQLAADCGTCSTTISEDALCRYLKMVAEANAGEGITYFEATTAAAFLAFADVRSDLVILETGMGGRLDATNVVERPRATIITPISHDHMEFLGSSLPEIAFEKSGILKRGVPCIVGPQPAEVLKVIESRAAELRAPLIIWGRDFELREGCGGLCYRSGFGSFEVAKPSLGGLHQVVNAGVAIAAAEVAFPRNIGRMELSAGIASAVWRARLERLPAGALFSYVADGTNILLDGTHNPGGALATADALRRSPKAGQELHIILGMMQGKDARGVISAFKGLASRVYTVAIPNEEGCASANELAGVASSEGFTVTAARGVPHALMLSRAAARGPAEVLIMGSIYLAGSVIKLNDHSC